MRPLWENLYVSYMPYMVQNQKQLNYQSKSYFRRKYH
jgi:hypothetical protein